MAANERGRSHGPLDRSLVLEGAPRRVAAGGAGAATGAGGARDPRGLRAREETSRRGGGAMGPPERRGEGRKAPGPKRHAPLGGVRGTVRRSGARRRAAGGRALPDGTQTAAPGLLVADPWPGRGGFGERRLAVTLYAGARGLALELGAREIVAKTDRIGADYLQEAGYRRWGGGYRPETARPARPRYKPLEGRRRGWGRLAGALVAALFPPGKSPAGLGEGIGYRTRRDAEGPKGRVGPDAEPERCPDDRA